MKVFISADIEGVTNTTIWEETEKDQAVYAAAARQMTAEVKAACEGAIAAGADYILVNDAHDYAVNLDLSQLPECAEVIRGWTGSPYAMVDGIDKRFDAAMFVGYHSAAGRCGNPLSHTYTTKTVWVKLNGVKCSEFRLYSWAAAMENVPTVLLTGDKMLCEDSTDIHPLCKSVAVKDGFGGLTRSISPSLACKKIRENAEAALKQDLSKALCTLPEHFVFEVCYKIHEHAIARSYYPGFQLVEDNVIRMETDNFMDVLRAVVFVL